MGEEAWDADPTEEGAVEQEPRTYYRNVDEFVREFLSSAYRRTLSDRGTAPFWDPEWWRHEEAIMRLEALWRAWEHLRLDPALGMSVWWRDHADHHMAALMGDTGPFRYAKAKTNPGEPLRYVPPPEGMFPD